MTWGYLCYISISLSETYSPSPRNYQPGGQGAHIYIADHFIFLEHYSSPFEIQDGYCWHNMSFSQSKRVFPVLVLLNTAGISKIWSPVHTSNRVYLRGSFKSLKNSQFLGSPRSIAGAKEAFKYHIPLFWTQTRAPLL